MPLLAVALASASPHAHPCRMALPRGPAVPAPVVLQTSCGGYELASDGRISRLPRHWFAKHSGGTGRRYGADIAVRRTPDGQILLLRHAQVIWRSRGLYRNDGSDVAFGPHEFAFAAYRRGIFLTDLDGPERLVMRGRGLYPYDFTRSGQLLVATLGRVDVLGRDGALLRGYRFRQANGLAFDPRRDMLYFVSPRGTLAAAEGARLRLVGRLDGIDGQMTFSSPGVLVFAGRRSLAVTGLDGRVVARASWPRTPLSTFDSGTSVSPDARTFAFRLSNAHPGAKGGAAAVYVLDRGERRARILYRSRLGPSGCAVGASMTWHGRFLLYSSADGQRVILDTSNGHVLDLASLARALPRLAPADRADAYWASDFHWTVVKHRQRGARLRGSGSPAAVPALLLAGLALVPLAAANDSSSGRVIVAYGVRVVVPLAGWQRVPPATPGAVTDPRTLLVVGTAGVGPLSSERSSKCQIAAYRIPPSGAAVVIVRWRSRGSAGGGPWTPGRAPLRKLRSVHRPSFECFAGRGAVADVLLGGHPYQVNVLVGHRASKERAAAALAVGRSFDLAR